MSGQRQDRRKYDSPKRRAAAADTRTAIIAAAQRCFERHGWNGTTVRLVADAAGVSHKTIEASFRTKAELLRASVDFAIRGDAERAEMRQRSAVAEMEAAPNAAAFLALHAAHLRSINARSAWLAAAVEQAAGGDDGVASLWKRMNHNRRFAVRWATDSFLGKPGGKAGLSRAEVEAVFWVALDWATYRTLTRHARLTRDQYEGWLRTYYAAVLLAAGPAARST
jgi:TetR/AcrR family transcriptional regulator of autoinduction and epiphytic fitness